LIFRVKYRKSVHSSHTFAQLVHIIVKPAHKQQRAQRCEMRVMCVRAHMRERYVTAAAVTYVRSTYRICAYHIRALATRRQAVESIRPIRVRTHAHTSYMCVCMWRARARVRFVQRYVIYFSQRIAHRLPRRFSRQQRRRERERERERKKVRRRVRASPASHDLLTIGSVSSKIQGENDLNDSCLRRIDCFEPRCNYLSGAVNRLKERRPTLCWICIFCTPWKGHVTYAVSIDLGNYDSRLRLNLPERCNRFAIDATGEASTQTRGSRVPGGYGKTFPNVISGCTHRVQSFFLVSLYLDLFFFSYFLY